MRSIVAACALLLAAGSLVGASERTAVRDDGPAVAIAQFSQAIPPEPPVVGELPGQHPMSAGAHCCRTNMSKAGASQPAAGKPCPCCRRPAAKTKATAK